MNFDIVLLLNYQLFFIAFSFFVRWWSAAGRQRQTVGVLAQQNEVAVVYVRRIATSNDGSVAGENLIDWGNSCAFDCIFVVREIYPLPLFLHFRYH
jgi:hypothetical protein